MIIAAISMPPPCVCRRERYDDGLSSPREEMKRALMPPLMMPCYCIIFRHAAPRHD